MERYPEPWLWEPLDGPFAYHSVPYIVEVDLKFQCLLCETGMINSEKTLQHHVHGRRHQRNYGLLEANRQAWWLDLQVPECVVVEDNFDEDDGTISYIMPFRRWRYNGWRAGMSCQLCGTGDFPTRWAVAMHCTTKRHCIYRSTTYMEYHVECRSLQPRLEKLPQMYEWHVQRALIHYVAAKEASFAGLCSRRYEWYQVLRTLQTYELRAQLVYLELAIWKQSLLRYDAKDQHISFGTLNEVYAFLQTPEAVQSYKKTKRVTSGIQEIMQGVIPFLRTIP
jgi:hypothetical protein